jgi:CRP/FNR family cyclic AMP-dependent transcriptional regulator
MSVSLNQDQELLRQFCAKYPLRYFKKNRPLYYQGEVPQTIFFIKSGVVKFYNITVSGDEKIIGYESKDGLMPVEWLFNRSPVSLYYYDTFTDSQLHAVPREDLISLVNENHSVALTLLERYVSLYIGAKMHLHALEQSKARDKLLHIFQYLAMRFGEPINKNQSKIELRLTHQDIASLIGMTRETVTSEISKLSKTGIIKTDNLHYLVDTDKALRMLGESDFSELNL